MESEERNHRAMLKSPVPKLKSDVLAAGIDRYPVATEAPSVGPLNSTAPSVTLASLELPLIPDGVSGRIAGLVEAGIKLLVYFATPL